MTAREHGLWLGILVVTGALVGCPEPETPARTCDTVVVDYEAALAEAQSCTQPEECGQPIAGTSCGCTRDLVARLDADLSDVVDLQTEAADLECELGGASVCDCPEALGFDCLEGSCAFNLVERYPFLPACPQTGDAYSLDDVRIVGDELQVDVSFGGGCAQHTVGLCWNDQAFQETAPVTAALTLFHDDGGDLCDAILSETHTFSLVPLEEAFDDAYGSATGEMRVNLDGTVIDYSF